MTQHRLKDILIGAAIATLFCSIFAFVYFRPTDAPAETFSGRLMGKAFPAARFTALSGEVLSADTIGSGKVILIFFAPDCDACAVESAFLSTQVPLRADVKFFGIIPIGEKQASLTAASANDRYPFKVYYDDDQIYRKSSNTIRVPLKVFIENGIVKKTWLGAAATPSDQAAFSKWLQGL